MSENIKQNFLLWDDFTNGALSISQALGETGWVITAIGTPSLGTSIVSGRIGILNIFTGAKSGNVTALHKDSGMFDLGLPNWENHFAVRRPISTNIISRIGFFADLVTNDPPSDGIYFEKLVGDSTWFSVTRSGSVETRNDTGISANDNLFHRLTLRKKNGDWEFWIDEVLRQTHSTDIITSPADWNFQIKTADNAAKSLGVDYISMGSLDLPLR